MKHEDRVILIVSALLLAAVLFGVTGCASHSQTAAQLDLNQQVREESTAKVDTEIHKVEGADKVTTTVEEFAPPAEEVVPTVPAERLRRSSHSNGISVAGGAAPGPLRGPLVKRTVTVAKRGPVTTDTHKKAASSAVGASTSTLDAQSKLDTSSKPSLGIPVLGLLIAGIGAAALATHTLWVGPLLTLAKRLLGRG